ncbi:MAG: response regulator, partial [Gammaproteobacteria bacterium]
ILTVDGHTIDIARGGKEALERLAQRGYGVVVTDLRMPDLDGRALFGEIQRRWPPLAEKVIFVTGDNLSREIREFLVKSGRPLIEKPFVPTEVRRVVANLNV